MSNEHILITGGTGYLGSHLVKYLLAKEYKISIVVREKSNFNRLIGLIDKINFIYVNKIEDFFQNNSIDGIIHTAACYGRKNEPISEIVESNVFFPLNLLRLAVLHKVKLFINTDTSLPKVLNAYSLSKYQFKEWIKDYLGTLKVVNVIPEYFYGPFDDNSKFVTNVLNKLLSNVECIDFTSCIQERDFIYIDDIVEAYGCILENINHLDSYTDIPVGSSQAIALKDLVMLIKKVTKNNATQLNFGKLPTRAGEIMSSKADITVLSSFGWSPKMPIENGLKKLLEIEYYKL